MSFNVPIESTIFSQTNKTFTNTKLYNTVFLIANNTALHIVIGVFSDSNSSNIMKSSNSGTTFSKILEKTTWQDLQPDSMITMSNDGQKICVLNYGTTLSNQALVYQSKDGGTTWIVKYPLGTGAFYNYAGSGIVSNSTGQYVVACIRNTTANTISMYVSWDYGDSFTKSTSTFPTGLFIADSNSNNITMDSTGQYIVVASLNNTTTAGGIWISTNYGSTWFRSSGAPFNVSYNDIKYGSSLLVAITNASTNKVWKSNRDGSSAWSNMTSIPNDDYRMVYMSGTNIVLGSSTKLYIYKDSKNTLENGVSYIINLPFTTFYYSICSDSSFTKFYFFSTQTTGAIPLWSSTTSTNPTNITNIFKAKGTNTAAVTGYKINNADLNTLFAPIGDGVSIGYNTGYTVNGNDLSTIFASK
jgi:hypothetical protein